MKNETILVCVNCGKEFIAETAICPVCESPIITLEEMEILLGYDWRQNRFRIDIQ